MSEGEIIPAGKPMPDELMLWQLEERRRNITEFKGRPSAAVAPLLTVEADTATGWLNTMIVCGLLRKAELIDTSTELLKKTYHDNLGEGGSIVFQAGLDALRNYYNDADWFDPSCFTTLLGMDHPALPELMRAPRCSLHFYDFRPADRVLKCYQVNAHAVIQEPEEAAFLNVYWHNALFHGPNDDAAVIRFNILEVYDTSPEKKGQRLV